MLNWDDFEGADLKCSEALINNLNCLNFSETQSSADITINTPPESSSHRTETMDGPESINSATIASSVPWPGDLYILRSTTTGEVLTLLEGNVIMSKPGGHGSIHWVCVEKGGWLGFRNPVSGKFLGHNQEGFLKCHADVQKGWERFCVRNKPTGGYVLYMREFENLWGVGLRDQAVEVKKGEKAKQPDQMLAKIEKGEPMIWEFIKV
jgi:hypothetical protein